MAKRLLTSNEMLFSPKTSVEERLAALKKLANFDFPPPSKFIDFEHALALRGFPRTKEGWQKVISEVDGAIAKTQQEISVWEQRLQYYQGLQQQQEQIPQLPYDDRYVQSPRFNLERGMEETAILDFQQSLPGGNYGEAEYQQGFAKIQQAIQQLQENLQKYIDFRESIVQQAESAPSEEEEAAARAAQQEEEDKDFAADIDRMVREFQLYGKEFANKAILELSNTLSTLRGQGRQKDQKPIDFLRTVNENEIVPLEQKAQQLISAYEETLSPDQLLQIKDPKKYEISQQLDQEKARKKTLSGLRTKFNNQLNGKIAQQVLELSGEDTSGMKADQKKQIIQGIYEQLRLPKAIDSDSARAKQRDFKERVISGLVQSGIEEWYAAPQESEIGEYAPGNVWGTFEDLVASIEKKLDKSLESKIESIIPGQQFKINEFKRLRNKKPEAPYTAPEDLKPEDAAKFDDWRTNMMQLAEIAKARENNQGGRIELTESEKYNLSNNLTYDLFEQWGKEKTQKAVPPRPNEDTVWKKLVQRGISNPTDEQIETQLRIDMRDWENQHGEAYKEQKGADPGSMVRGDTPISLVESFPLESDLIPEYKNDLLAQGATEEEASDLSEMIYKGEVLNQIAEMINSDPDLVETMRGFGRSLNSVLRLSPQGLKNPVTKEDLTRPAAGKSAGTEIFFDILKRADDPAYETGFFAPGRIKKQIDYILKGIDDPEVKERLASDPKLQKQLAYEAAKRYVVYEAFNFKREILRQLTDAKRNVGMYLEGEREDLGIPEEFDEGAVSGGFLSQYLEEMGSGAFEDILAATSDAFSDRGAAGSTRFMRGEASPDDEYVGPSTVDPDSVEERNEDEAAKILEDHKSMAARMVLSGKGELEQELWDILYNEGSDRAFLWTRTKDKKKLDIPTYQVDNAGNPKINWNYVSKQLQERGLLEEGEITEDPLTGEEILPEDPRIMLQKLYKGLVKEVQREFVKDDADLRREFKIQDLRRAEDKVRPKEKQKGIRDLQRERAAERPGRGQKVKKPKPVMKTILEERKDPDTGETTKVYKDVRADDPNYADAVEVDPKTKRPVKRKTGPNVTEQKSQRPLSEQGVSMFSKRIAQLRKLMKWNG